jgi:hypothetical protein
MYSLKSASCDSSKSLSRVFKSSSDPPIDLRVYIGSSGLMLSSLITRSLRSINTFFCRRLDFLISDAESAHKIFARTFKPLNCSTKMRLPAKLVPPINVRRQLRTASLFEIAYSLSNCTTKFMAPLLVANSCTSALF